MQKSFGFIPPPGVKVAQEALIVTFSFHDQYCDIKDKLTLRIEHCIMYTIDLLSNQHVLRIIVDTLRTVRSETELCTCHHVGFL